MPATGSITRALTRQVTSSKGLNGRSLTTRSVTVGVPRMLVTKAVSEKATRLLAMLRREKKSPPATAPVISATQNWMATVKLARKECGTMEPKPMVDML